MVLRKIVNHRAAAGLIYIPVAAASGLISSTAILAHLSVDGSGLFFLCQAMLPFLLLFDLGLLVIGTREIAFATGREQEVDAQPATVREVLQTFLRFRDARVVTLILLGLSALAGGLIMVFQPALRANANAQAILLSILAAGLVLSSYVYQSFLEGTGNYHLDRLASTGTTLMSGLMIAAMAFWTNNIWWTLAAWYAGQAVTVAVKALLAHRIDNAIHRPKWPDCRSVATTLQLSFSIFVLQLGATITKSFQYPVITAVLGVASLGTYFFVVRIAATIDQAISVLNASQRAIFSQLYAGKRFREARRLMLVVFGQVLCVSILGAGVVALLLPMAVRPLTSHSDVMTIPFWVIGCDLIAMCTSGMMSQFVVASGRNPFPRMMLVTGAITIFLLMLLVPRYGLTGAALSQFIANAGTNLGFSAWHFTRLARFLYNKEVNIRRGPS